jgi:hypothetical protein
VHLPPLHLLQLRRDRPLKPLRPKCRPRIGNRHIQRPSHCCAPPPPPPPPPRLVASHRATMREDRLTRARSGDPPRRPAMRVASTGQVHTGVSATPRAALSARTCSMLATSVPVDAVDGSARGSIAAQRPRRGCPRPRRRRVPSPPPPLPPPDLSRIGSRSAGSRTRSKNPRRCN